MANFEEDYIPGLDQAVDLLSSARFDFPSEALWDHADGLPAPNDPQFAQTAAGFLTENPIHPPGRTLAVWEVLQVASRQCKCLSYLASQKKKARRKIADLCIAQAIQMQWLLPLLKGPGSSEGTDCRAFYAASGSLGFTGILLLGQVDKSSVLYEVGTQWMRTGVGQFVTYGDRKHGTLQKAASALIGDAIEDRRMRDLQGTDDTFFSEIDLTRPDMREVARRMADGDLEQVKKAYVEVLALRFSDKLDRPGVRATKDAIDQEAEDICRNIFLLTIHMYKRVDFGEEVDWSRVIDNDIESRVWLNGHHALMKLLSAYQKTGNEKYVKHLCRLFNSWYETSPPTFERTVAQWRTHEVAIRPDRRWPVILAALADHPAFKETCLFHMARSMLDHGKYLAMYASSGGNWLQAEATGLGCVALLFPEFKLSPLFYKTGLDRLERANANYFLADGLQSECTPGYHGHALSGMSTLLDLAKRFEAPMPTNVIKQYEAAIAAARYIAYPDLTLAMLSDQGPSRISIREHLDAAHSLERKNLPEALQKKTGAVHLSHDFTHAGYCVMRDKWGPDGQVLIFDAGYFGSGHQHEDKLNFVYYAKGRELIGDPGIYAYVRDSFAPYWRGTWSHNTVAIDGLSQHRALGPPEDIPDPDRRFVIGGAFDFAVGWYKHAYSPRGSEVWEGKARNPEMDRARAIRDVQHQRSIFYVKGKYAVICDRVLGVDEHQIELIFHPAPVPTGEGTAVRMVDLEIRPDCVVVTREREHPNVAIIPAQVEGVEVLDFVGKKNPHRGWYSLDGIQPSHDIVYRSFKHLPVHFETVVQPLPAGDGMPMKVTSIPAECESGKDVAAIVCGEDLILVSYNGPAKIKCRDVNFEGSVLFLQYGSNGKGSQAHMVDGRALSIGDKKLFSTDTPPIAFSLDVR